MAMFAPGTRSEWVEDLVAVAAAPLEQQPRIAVELVGEDVQHRGDVFTRIFPVGAVADGIEIRPDGREQVRLRIAERCFQIVGNNAREQLCCESDA